MVGIPWTGTPGINESVAVIQARQQQSEHGPRSPSWLIRPRLRDTSPRKQADSVVTAESPASASATALGPLIAQTTGVSFLASANSTGPWPPDTMGDVGPSQILVCLNNQFISFNKNGTADGALNVTPDNFFASVGGTTYGTSDPRVRYDRLSQRWFITMITVNTPNYVLIAVSSGPQVSSTSSFTFYRFQHDLVGATPNSDTGGFADYDTLGVDANALYIGANIFDSLGIIWIGSTGFVVNKANLLAGTLTVTAFRQIATSSASGPYTPQGVHNDDPAATEGYFIGVDSRFYNRLSVRRITNPGGTPSISANMSVSTSATGAPLGGVPCLGSTSPLDDLDYRLFGANMHNGRLWTAHNIQVNSSGTFSSSGGRDGARWYELKNMTTTPVVNQSGTVFNSASSNPPSYFIPTIAASGQGHALLGCTVAGANEHAEIAVTSRLATDATGTMQTPVVLVNSSSTYNAGYQNGAYRWGDYSRVTVDPNDDMTFWTFQEYCSGTDTYGVRVIQLKAPLPATPLACNPATIIQGFNNVSLVVTGAVAGGTGFFDPGSSFPNHISAVINSGGVTVNSITYNSPSNITLNVSIAANAAVGTRTVTVTNPDGQSATSASGILAISTPSPLLRYASSTLIGGNGDQSVAPGECNDLTVVVRNDGSSTASNISATLATTTPGLAVTQPNSSYPDITVGATATNATSFRISASPSFSPGTTINLTFALNYSGGSTNLAFTLSSSGGNLSGAGIFYVDKSYQGAVTNGSICAPFKTVTNGYAASQNGNTIRIFNGNYNEAILMNKQLLLQATNGVVNIGTP